MKIEKIKLVWFSPTGTTKKVLEGIAAGFNGVPVECIDITNPGERENKVEISATDLLILGSPVYMGRIPALLNDWFNSLKADKTPAICVVVYGNRVYDDALIELNNILLRRGCIPVAAAAFIGEHSFSGQALPIANGRPDDDDLKRARLFGAVTEEKILSMSSADKNPGLVLPGNFPYGGITDLWDVDFIEVGENCDHCGICSEVCPVGAISKKDSFKIDVKKCITCCGCIKHCPRGARKIKPGPVMEAAKRLHKLYRQRKEPELFI